MRALSIIVLLALLAATFRFGYKNVELQRSLQAVSDTLLSQKIQQQFLTQKSFEELAKFGERELRKNDSTAETHRIIANYDISGLFLLRFELGLDGSIRSVFRKVKIKRPLPSDLKKVEFIIDSAAHDIKLRDIQRFKDKLSQANLLDATLENQLMCCFGGGSLTWEAELADGNRHTFSTYCRQSVQFTEACEFLLEQVDDADLKKTLDWTRQ
ncbi:MAG TPA: hypothetical protein PK228_21015 [Saprospiraceae bacterium]|nr:hypothetical protein [Saprospiraceae bacterium]